MNDTKAATAVDCECGDPERMHQWASVAISGLHIIGPCASRERLPREGDDPQVRFKLCPCRQYKPKTTPDPTGGFLPR